MAGSTRRDLFLQVSANTDGVATAMQAGRAAMLKFGDTAVDMQAEVRKTFQDLGADKVETNLRTIDASYKRMFASVRANARAAMDAPTPQAAVSIINASGADQAASAAEAQAAAFRVTADAASAYAMRIGDASAETRLMVASLEAAAIAQSQEAAALRGQATLAAGVHAEMVSMGAISDDTSDKVVAGHTRMGASGMILQHVMRSTTDSFAAGLPPTMIFAEQIGRLSEAAALAGGSMGKFGALMGGPWGMAITAAVSVGSSLIGTLLEGGDAAEKDAQAHNALKDAVDRLNESQAALNHSTRQGIQDDLDAAQASRTREIQVRKLIDAELDAAKAKLSAARQTMSAPGGSVPGAMFSIGTGQAAGAQGDIDALEATRKLNDKKTADAMSAIRVGTGKLIARRVEGDLDPKTRVKNSYEDEADRLQRLHDKGRLSDDAYANGLRKAGQSRDEALEALKPERKHRTKVDHTVQREANADRAYESQLAQAQDRYAKAQLGLSDTAEGRYKVEIDELRAAKVSRDREISDQLKAGKFGAAGGADAKAKADQLLKLNALTLSLDEELATRKQAQAILDRQLDADQRALSGMTALVRLQANDAVGSRQRKAFGLRLLDQEEQATRLTANRDIASDDPERQKKGRSAIAQVEAQHPYRVKEVEDQNRDPMEDYRERLKSNVGDMNDALKGVEADGLKGVEDGLLGIIDGTESAASAFKKMAASIISDLARIAIEKLILSVVGLKDGGPVLHLAGGGAVFGPGGPREDRVPAMLSAGEYVVNAAAYAKHPELVEAINHGRLPGFADGGLVGGRQIYMRGLPSIGSLARPMVVQQTFAIDAKGAILADALMGQMQRVSSAHAQAAMVGGAHLAQTEMADDNMTRIPS